MSKFDVSDFDANELNQAIDATNFPQTNGATTSSASANGKDEEESEAVKRRKTPSMPLPVKQNGSRLEKSYSDDVFALPATPRTPRSIPTPGNCECHPISSTSS
jgi:hypothetical protein